MFNVVLHAPEIPPNTGNIIRLCANNKCVLHLIEPLGFKLETKELRRAGLDYLDIKNINIHKDYASFIQKVQPQRVFACTTKGTKYYYQEQYKEGDTFLFGSETKGLPPEVMNHTTISQWIKIPMAPNNRSLNLSNSVAIITYEGCRQNNFNF